MKYWIFKYPFILKLFLNLFPPLFFSDIKITYISQDFHRFQIKLRNWPGTRNANGSQFGGSLFSMSDAVYGTILMAILGDKYYVWDKKSVIDFKHPGYGAVYLEGVITPLFIREIIEHTKNGEKYFPTVFATVHDKKGNEIATVSRTLYVRLKNQYRQSSSSFSSTPLTEKK